MQVKLRILLPWFPDAEAVAALLGFRLPAAGEDVAAARAKLEAQRGALAARAPVGPPSPVEPLPSQTAAAGEAALEVYRALNPARPARAGVVDLAELVSFQRSIHADGIEDRVASAQAGDWPALAAVTLPPFAPDEEIKGAYDVDGKGVTITSANPNLRAGPVQMMRGPMGQVVGFQVLFGMPFLRVGELDGRHFLLDGYHRACGLLARGIRRVPCLFEQVPSLADITADAAFRIGHEHLVAPRPPLVRDFLDPELSVTIPIAAFRKVVRIRAEEFNVDLR